MRVPIEDMTFILRSAGERTLAPAADLLRALIQSAGGDPSAQLTIVAERPFAAGVRRTFQIGLDAHRPWVIGMDADVLLLSDAIDRLGHLCAAADGAVFSIASLVLCRFHGGLCFRGIHAYPRRHLHHALPLVSDADLRPESCVARALEPRGLRAWGPPVPIGIHDHAQFLRHVYVKMRLRARRELADGGDAALDQALAALRVPRRSAAGFGVPRRSAAGSSDPRVPHRSAAGSSSPASTTYCPDLLIAQWGLLDGAQDARSNSAPAHYDWNNPYPEFTARLQKHNLSELPPMLESAHGLAEAALAAHDYQSDTRTPAWIRERLGFERGPAHALRRIGLGSPNPALNIAVPGTRAPQSAQRPAA